MCRTYGQCLHTKATSNAGAAAKSSRCTLVPATSSSANSGAGVPSGTIRAREPRPSAYKRHEGQRVWPPRRLASRWSQVTLQPDSAVRLLRPSAQLVVQIILRLDEDQVSAPPRAPASPPKFHRIGKHNRSKCSDVYAVTGRTRRRRQSGKLSRLKYQERRGHANGVRTRDRRGPSIADQDSSTATTSLPGTGAWRQDSSTTEWRP
jgi:hypothetical protein